MSVFNLISLSLVVVLIQLVLPTLQSDQYDLPLNQSFAVIKDLNRIVIYPEEIIRLPLSNYFRGPLIEYVFEVAPYNDSSNYDESMVTITPPYEIIHEEDFEQFEGQQSLPQTSVVYCDDYAGFFLVFIDFDMNLIIYDISDYAIKGPQSQIHRLSKTNIFKNQDLSQDKQCTNLIILEKAKLMANCKSNKQWGDQQDQFYGVSVMINISVIEAPTVRYFVNNADFQSMKDGVYRYVKKINYTYIILVKKYKTSCYFNFESMDGFLQPKIIRQIYNFDNPLSMSTDDLKAKYDQQNPLIIDEAQRCNNRRLNYQYSDQIEQLRIQDVNIVPYYENIVVATDYFQGILFLNINCSTIASCSYYPHYKIPSDHLGSIFVLDLDPPDEQKLIFIMKLSPPGVLELNFDNQATPFIQRGYFVSDDDGDFVSMNSLTANQNYVVVQYMSILDLKPLLRVFSRTSSHFSIGYTEIKYSEMFDSGILINFMNKFENFLFLKTSDLFRIYRFDNYYLQINGSNATYLQEQNMLNNKLQVLVAAKNYWNDYLLNTVDILYISDEFALSPFAKLLGSDDEAVISIDFDCGSSDARDIDISDFYDGPINQLIMQLDTNYSNSTFFEPYFEFTNYVNVNSTPYKYNITSCTMPEILTFKSYYQDEKRDYLACFTYEKDYITLIDTFNQTDNPQDNVDSFYNFTLPGSSILQVAQDIYQDVFFVLSNTSSSGQVGAYVHIFKLYNKLLWEQSIDLLVEFKDILGPDFRFREFNSLSYEPNSHLGVLISQPVNNGTYMNQLLGVFGLNNSDQNNRFQIVYNISVSIPVNTNKQVYIINAKINTDGVWILTSDNMIHLYVEGYNQFVNQGYRNDDVQRRTKSLFLKNIYSFRGGNHIGLPIRQFKIFGSVIVIFFGDNFVEVYSYSSASTRLSNLMILPILAGEASDKNIKYSFIENKFLKVVHTTVIDTNIYFGCKKTIDNKFAGYYIFGFDISKTRHKTLLFKGNLSISEDQLDEYYFNIRILDSDQKSTVLIITLSQSTFVIFNYNVVQTISLMPEKFLSFIETCKNNDFTQSYTIYPTDNKNEKIRVQINSQNYGKIAYLDQIEAEMTISRDSSAQLVAADTLFGRYSLTQNVHGQDLAYNYSCLDTTDQITEIPCNEVYMNDDFVSGTIQLEMLGSQQTLLGFFVIESFMLFLDQGQLIIYNIDKDDSIKIPIQRIFQDFHPSGYFLSSHSVNDQVTAILIGVDEDLKLVNTYIYINETFNTSTLNPQNYLHFFNSQIYIQNLTNFTSLTMPVDLVEIYLENNTDKIIGIFSYNLKNDAYQSRLNFYEILKDQSSNQISYNFLQSKTLSDYQLGLNTFRINSLGIKTGSTILFLGIEDYGLILINMKNYKIIKMISLQSLSFSSSFQISQVIFESFDTTYIVIQGHGLISMQFQYQNLTKKQNSTNGIVLEPQYKNHVLFNEFTEVLGNNWYARDHLGFAYLEKQTNKLELGQTEVFNYVRFVNYFAMSDSKSMNTSYLDDDDCQYLQKISSKVIKRNFFSGLLGENDYFFVGTVCSRSTLKIYGQNFHPQLIVKIPQNNSIIEYSQLIRIKVQGPTQEEFILEDGSEKEDFNFDNIVEFFINVTVLNNERKVNEIIYILFIIGLSGILWLLSVALSNQPKRESKTEENNRNADDQSLKQSQDFSYLDRSSYSEDIKKNHMAFYWKGRIQNISGNSYERYSFQSND
ncbi:UNKNOWN [Stylonychia lemnae]|uniref:Transmembrane protein n=1 Tax=Stylonychia lemnae TaxID=5949 RepID=A0A078B6E8_STYLE|nr:UNKNOWN [Stylonychia lemnae]|eukprot:CDW90100.1 UNKNOWN [Stylonychia lemnae]